MWTIIIVYEFNENIRRENKDKFYKELQIAIYQEDDNVIIM